MHLVSFRDAIVQYSCAMNTQCIQHSFCNCMFVAGRGGTLAQIRTLVFMPDKEWESGYNHGLLHCATQVVEIWLYSCMYCWLDSVKIFMIYRAFSSRAHNSIIEMNCHIGVQLLQYVISSIWISI